MYDMEKRVKENFCKEKTSLSEILLITRGVPKKEIAGEKKLGYISVREEIADLCSIRSYCRIEK